MIIARLADPPAVTPDLLHRWIEPLGLVVMMLVGLAVALLVVRRHGRAEQRRLARAERKHPFAAPVRTLVAFGIAFASVIVFARIAREVVEGETSTFDNEVALAIHGLDNAVMDVAMRAITFMGSAFAVIPIALVVLAWAVRRKEHRAAVALVIVLVMTEALNVVLKSTFGRARPTLFQEIDTLHSYSFPSGHAMAAVATYGMMGIVVARLAPERRRLLLITLPAFIFMIGLSRVYLGVHWPTDVLAGFAAGGFLLLAGAITLDGLAVVSRGPRPSSSPRPERSDRPHERREGSPAGPA